MKIRILLCSLAAALLVGTSYGAEDTPLQMKMQKMNSAFRKLRTQVTDASKNDDSVAQAEIIKENATDALKLTPMKAEDTPEADRAKFMADYQAEMKQLIAAVDKLEVALKAGNNEEAQKIFAEIGGIQKDGHKEFKKAPQRKQQ